MARHSLHSSHRLRLGSVLQTAARSSQCGDHLLHSSGYGGGRDVLFHRLLAQPGGCAAHDVGQFLRQRRRSVGAHDGTENPLGTFARWLCRRHLVLLHLRGHLSAAVPSAHSPDRYSLGYRHLRPLHFFWNYLSCPAKPAGRLLPQHSPLLLARCRQRTRHLRAAEGPARRNAQERQFLVAYFFVLLRALYPASGGTDS